MQMTTNKLVINNDAAPPTAPPIIFVELLIPSWTKLDLVIRSFVPLKYLKIQYKVLPIEEVFNLLHIASIIK